MPRKKAVKAVKENLTEEKVVGVTGCETCGRPSAYINIDGGVFCGLSCETKN